MGSHCGKTSFSGAFQYLCIRRNVQKDLVSMVRAFAIHARYACGENRCTKRRAFTTVMNDGSPTPSSHDRVPPLAPCSIDDELLLDGSIPLAGTRRRDVSAAPRPLPAIASQASAWHSVRHRRRSRASSHARYRGHGPRENPTSFAHDHREALDQGDTNRASSVARSVDNGRCCASAESCGDPLHCFDANRKIAARIRSSATSWEGV
jgi:hypothetical protein